MSGISDETVDKINDFLIENFKKTPTRGITITRQDGRTYSKDSIENKLRNTEPTNKEDD